MGSRSGKGKPLQYNIGVKEMPWLCPLAQHHMHQPGRWVFNTLPYNRTHRRETWGGLQKERTVRGKWFT
jgi:hypothetical protein